MSSFDVDVVEQRLSKALTAASAPKPKARKRRTQADRSDETRARVIEAAAKVLRRKGYAGLRIDEVSRVAKVSRGAQQYHFKTKDSLVLATAEYLLQSSLQRGMARMVDARRDQDPIEAIIQDCFEFFLGPDFPVILDLVLASSKDRSLRARIYAYTRESRLKVEDAWLAVLCEHGLPSQTAEKVLWLTIGIVRGFSVRALWQNDPVFFRGLMDDWKLILSAHLKTVTKENRE